jgi:hypothetical protein
MVSAFLLMGMNVQPESDFSTGRHILKLRQFSNFKARTDFRLILCVVLSR